MAAIPRCPGAPVTQQISPISHYLAVTSCSPTDSGTGSPPATPWRGTGLLHLRVCTSWVIHAAEWYLLTLIALLLQNTGDLWHCRKRAAKALLQPLLLQAQGLGLGLMPGCTKNVPAAGPQLQQDPNFTLGESTNLLHFRCL